MRVSFASAKAGPYFSPFPTSSFCRTLLPMKTRPTRTSAKLPDVTDRTPNRDPDRAPARLRPRRSPRKKPFDIDAMMRLIRAAVKPYTPAAMFQLYDEGYTSVFEILVGCIISIRTLDEVTLTTSRRLFEVARTPAEIAALSPTEIDRLIGSCTFHGPKTRTIYAIATEAVEKHAGRLPCDFET